MRKRRARRVVYPSDEANSSKVATRILKITVVAVRINKRSEINQYHILFITNCHPPTSCNSGGGNFISFTKSWTAAFTV